MSWTAGRVAELVGAAIEGDPGLALTGLASLEHAGPADLSFCTGGRWLSELDSTRAGAVILGEGRVPEGVVALRHPNPRHAFARAATAMSPRHWPAPGVHPLAWVDPSAQVEGATIEPFAVIEAGAIVGPGAWVQPHAYVGRDAIVGPGSRLMPQAVVMDGCRLGERVVLKPGAVIGADGFGFAPAEDGVLKVPQLGVAVLADDVEIGANTCVDRAALGETRVEAGAKLDNLVQVAHNVRVGAGSLLAAFCGVAGGASLGRGVVMGGRAAVIDGIEVGDNVIFAALASASRDVPDGSRLGGSPARPYREWLRETAAIRALPALLREFAHLEDRIEALEARLLAAGPEPTGGGSGS